MYSVKDFTIFIVTELNHQLIESLSVLFESEATLFDPIGEPIVGQRWRNDVKGGSFFSGLLCEQWE